jgi:hypothetical protein
VFLVIAYLGAVGTVPPSISALYTSALVGAAVLTLWSWWADAHRAPAPGLEVARRLNA